MIFMTKFASRLECPSPLQQKKLNGRILPNYNRTAWRCLCNIFNFCLYFCHGPNLFRELLWSLNFVPLRGMGRDRDSWEVHLYSHLWEGNHNELDAIAQTIHVTDVRDPTYRKAYWIEKLKCYRHQWRRNLGATGLAGPQTLYLGRRHIDRPPLKNRYGNSVQSAF